MENTSKNIQTIAFFFFFATGGAYLLSSLLAENQNFLPLTATLRSTLFLPAIIMGLTYGAASILDTLASEGKNSRMQMATTIGLFFLVGAGITFIHFFL